METEIDFAATLDPQPQSPEIVEPANLPSVFDPAPVAQRLGVYDRELELLVVRAREIEVRDDGSLRLAVETAAAAKKLDGAIEKLRKQWVEEPNRFVRTVNNLAKRYQDNLKQVEVTLKRKISDYQYQVELERRKAEARAREEARKLQERLQAEAEAAGVEAPEVATPVIPERATTVRTAKGSAIQRTQWTFEVVDPLLVPREYLMVDEKAIRAAVRAGVREIPGVRIYEEFVTVIR